MFNSLRDRFRLFIGKTREVSEEKKEPGLTIETKLKSVVRGKVRLSDKDIDPILDDLGMGLIQSDVAVETTDAIVQKLRNKLSGQEVQPDDVNSLIRSYLREILIGILKPREEMALLEKIKNSPRPFKIVFFGINGGGKTTTIAKVASYLMKNGFSVVLAAGDTFRAGAIEQLEKHSKALGVKMITHQKGADAAAVVYDAVEHAKARRLDAVLADTAGRMQTNVNLMDEMKKICRVNKPDLRIFVGDALAGNDAVEQARHFNESIGIDAIVLTKMDADAKGGCAVSITHETKCPILFIGTGQGYNDLRPFDREWFVDQII